MVLIDLVTAEHGMKKVCVCEVRSSNVQVGVSPPLPHSESQFQRRGGACRDVFPITGKKCVNKERFNNKEIRQTFTIKSKSDESISDIGYQTLTHTQ